MQNAVDIIAMVQKTSAPKTKFDVPGRPLAVERNSFKKELSEARRDYSKANHQDFKKADQTTQRTTEKRAEKLAKVMSNSNTKVEVKETAQKAAATANQSESVHQTKEQAAVEAETETMTKVSETDILQSVLSILQQLLQQLQGMQVQDASQLQTLEGEANLQELVQQLDQMLILTQTGQTTDLGEKLEAVKAGMAELLKELSIVKQNPEQQIQTTKFAAELIDKLNELEPALHQQLKETKLAKDGQVPVNRAVFETLIKEDANNNVKTAATEYPVEGTVVGEADVAETAKSKNAEDDKSNENTESSYAAKLTDNTKQAITTDKPVQNFEQLVAVGGEKLNVELNIKHNQVNLEKQSLVQVSKTDIINQVVKKAEIAVHDGRQEMIMKLEPESLGKLNLKVSVENGIITAKFLAESQQVKEVLESSFNQLKDALQEKGIAVQSFSVSVGQEGKDFQSQQGFEQWKKSIKISSKPSGSYLALDDENTINVNPYSYHDGKVDYKA